MTMTQVQSTSSPSSTLTQAVNSNSGLSTRAKTRIGVGVGVGIGTPFLAGLVFAAFWYSKRFQRWHRATEENGENRGHAKHELDAIESQRRPLHNAMELDAAERPMEVPRLASSRSATVNSPGSYGATALSGSRIYR